MKSDESYGTEKGNRLTPQGIHVRLQVIEVVVGISLVLNLVHWYVTGIQAKEIKDQVANLSQQTGVQK